MTKKLLKKEKKENSRKIDRTNPCLGRPYTSGPGNAPGGSRVSPMLLLQGDKKCSRSTTSTPNKTQKIY